jgi:hypothetical protein
MSERIKAWWWITRHPLKSIAIRRWINERSAEED